MRCDSHVHVVGPLDRYPQVAERTYLADVATLKQLESVSATRAFSRFVIVQPSFYGTDNSVLLESLDALAGRGRGIVVINPETTSARMLSSMAGHGVCGLRLNDNAVFLRSSRTPVVIDHYGLHGPSVPDQAEGRALLDLLSMSHVWIKLSAPYRVSPDPLATKPNPAWLSAILEVAPDRCVWGSDWPHTPPHEAQMGGGVLGAYRSLRYEALVDDFMAALGARELTERILSENPTRLYGFE